MERWEDIKRCSELRRMRLNDSKDCQSFLISIHDVSCHLVLLLLLLILLIFIIIIVYY